MLCKDIICGAIDVDIDVDRYGNSSRFEVILYSCVAKSLWLLCLVSPFFITFAYQCEIETNFSNHLNSILPMKHSV